MRPPYSLHTDVTEEEMEKISFFMREKDIPTKAHFVREAINHYTGEIIFGVRDDPRPKEEPYYENYGWKFAGGRVVFNMGINRVQIFFDKEAPREAVYFIRLRNYAWNSKAQVWQHIINRSTIRSLQECKYFVPVDGDKKE